MTARILFTVALVISGLAWTFAVPSISSADSSCTHYASPAGTGSGVSASQPFKIADFWPRAKPGYTLCLLDGQYTGPTSMVTPPSGLSGNSTAPITIRAANDGAVWINGQGSRQPVLLRNNDWFILAGFNASHSSSTVIAIGSGSDNNIVRRVCAWDAPPAGNNRVWGFVGSNTLVEDSCGFGTGRSIFQLSWGGNDTVLRRTWAMFEKDTSSTGPGQAYHFAYHSTRNTLENVIGTWQSAPGDAARPSAVVTIASEGTDHKLLGSIIYVLASDVFQPSKLITTDWKPGANVPTLIKDTVVYTGQSSKRPFILHDRPCEGCRMENATEIGGIVSTIGKQWTIINQVTAETVAEAPNIWSDAGTKGARVCKRYKNGVLTSEPLWPWPMDQRIRAALALAGKNPDAIFGGPGKTVTDLMEGIFGTIPRSCKTS